MDDGANGRTRKRVVAAVIDVAVALETAAVVTLGQSTATDDDDDAVDPDGAHAPTVEHCLVAVVVATKMATVFGGYLDDDGTGGSWTPRQVHQRQSRGSRLASHCRPRPHWLGDSFVGCRTVGWYCCC